MFFCARSAVRKGPWTGKRLDRLRFVFRTIDFRPIRLLQCDSRSRLFWPPVIRRVSAPLRVKRDAARRAQLLSRVLGSQLTSSGAPASQIRMALLRTSASCSLTANALFRPVAPLHLRSLSQAASPAPVAQLTRSTELEGLTYLELNRPQAKNALSVELVDRTRQLVEDVRFDGFVRLGYPSPPASQFFFLGSL